MNPAKKQMVISKKHFANNLNSQFSVNHPIFKSYTYYSIMIHSGINALEFLGSAVYNSTFQIFDAASFFKYRTFSSMEETQARWYKSVAENEKYVPEIREKAAKEACKHHWYAVEHERKLESNCYSKSNYAELVQSGLTYNELVNQLTM